MEMLFPSYTAKLQEELWVFLHHSQSPSELSWSYRCPALHRVFLATAAFRALERKLLSSELGSSVITCLKSQIHKRTAHSLLVSEKKKKGHISQWLPGQKELLAAEHLWKNALLRSVNENGIFLKTWIRLGTISTWKFGPRCFWNT